MTLLEDPPNGLSEHASDTSRDPVAAIAAAKEALARLAELDLDELSDDELSGLVLEHQRLRGQLEAAEASALSRWNARRCWQPSGAKTGAAWLAWKQRIPIQVARQRIRHARALRTLPEVEQAWADGEIDRSHLTTLLGARNPRTQERFDAEYEDLLDVAKRSGFVEFRRYLDYWNLTADPDGAEQSADDDHAAREVHLSRSFGGMWFGKITLDPIAGEIVHTTLAEIERELFEADWAAAKERLGREPTVLELHRTPAQRRADALVEMATRARTAPANGRRPAPLFTVLVGYETLTGTLLELFNRTVLTPAGLAPHLTEADVERIVFEGRSLVIDVGARTRFYRGALRRAIEVRDRTCFHPSCDEAPQRAEIDHIHEAARGGATTQRNGRLGCGFHNRRRNSHPDDWAASPDLGDPDAGPDPPGV